MNAVWVKYLPGFVRSRIDGRPRLQSILSNSGWLFADRILRMSVGLVVGVWVARYLGPAQYGLWNYAIAFAALLGSFATLGLDNIVVRELVRTPQRQDDLLGTSLVLKLLSGVAALAVAMLAIAAVRPGDVLSLALVGLAAAGFMFQAVNVVAFYFQAKVQSKFTVYATNAAFTLTAVVKVALILAEAPLIAFALAGLVELVMTAAFLVIAFRSRHHDWRKWRFRKEVALELLRESWPLMLSGVAIMTYTRVDQILIGQMLDEHAVGIYSAAMRISEIWYFVPVALAASVFPSILQSRERGQEIYLRRLQSLLDVFAILAILFALGVTFSAEALVRILYGAPYAVSAEVLQVHAWSGVLISLTVAAGGWFLAEGLQKLALRRTLIGAASNVALNLVLIPRFGVVGAAWAAVVSQALCVASNALTRDTRRVFVMQIKALGLHGIFGRMRLG